MEKINYLFSLKLGIFYYIILQKNINYSFSLRPYNLLTSTNKRIKKSFIKLIWSWAE